MFKALFSAATGALGGIQTYLIVGAIALVVGSAGGAYAGYRWEHSAVLKLQLADAQFVTKSVNAARISDALQAKVDLAAAVGAQKAFDDLHVKYVTLTQEITRYVTPVQDAKSCITVGLARSLRAEADGSDAANLQLAPGQSDDDCSDATASEVAGWFKAYGEAANHDALQLNLLEADIRDKHDAQVTAGAQAPVAP